MAESRRATRARAAKYEDDVEHARVGQSILRIPAAIVEEIRADLRRPHPFAAERVGFVTVAAAPTDDGVVAVAAEYHGVPDDHYVPGRGAGARIGTAAIREAVSRALLSGRGIFHVHVHDHAGIPSFSFTDRTEQPLLVESFRAVAPTQPHGMIVLSSDSANAWMWLPGDKEPSIPARLTLVGYPMRLHCGESLRFDRPARGRARTDRFVRQSFLGAGSEAQLASVRIGLLGFGGGGSHVGQQLAYVGAEDVRVADDDRIDRSNLNRLVGGTAADVVKKRLKVEIAKRVMSGINRKARTTTHAGKWQERVELFRACDIIIGCVDSFAQRQEAEVLARRFAIPYVDIGMDVHQVEGEPPRMGGQIILSMPGGPCMTCLGFLTPERLAQEAARYGDTGGRPQVIWPNGILASSAVGIIVDLVTGWSGIRHRLVYLSYDGNRGTLTDHVRLTHLRWTSCPHFPLSAMGLPRFSAV